jgi:hypothetical protein
MLAAEVPERIAKFGSMSNLKGDNLCSGPLFFGLNYRSRSNVSANPGCQLQLFNGAKLQKRTFQVRPHQSACGGVPRRRRLIAAVDYCTPFVD